jgi:hypothetical protein
VRARFAHRQRTKLNSRFESPDSLSLAADGGAPARYDLHGAVIHIGEAVAGHFVSVIRLGGRWLKFNDSKVSEIAASEFHREVFGGAPPPFSSTPTAARASTGALFLTPFRCAF